MTDLPTPFAGQAPRPRVGLASGSPRRHALLRELGVEPVTLASGIDESRRAAETVVDYVRRLALEKARHGCASLPAPDLPVLGGDTAVCIGETLFDKPADADEARHTLKTLSGREHTVHSAVALVTGRGAAVTAVATTVRFRTLEDADIEAYVASGEPFGKAGAYAVQGLGGTFVASLSGSYTGVVGLPVFETAALLRDAGIDVVALAAGRVGT